MPCNDCGYYKPGHEGYSCWYLSEEDDGPLPEDYIHPGCVVGRLHRYWQESITKQGRIEYCVHLRIRFLEDVRNAAEGLKYAVENKFPEITIDMYSGFLQAALRKMESFDLGQKERKKKEVNRGIS